MTVALSKRAKISAANCLQHPKSLAVFCKSREKCLVAYRSPSLLTIQDRGEVFQKVTVELTKKYRPGIFF